MKKHTIIASVLFVLFYSTILFSQTIPQTINYQGVLKDPSGVVVTNGDYNLTFKLYDVETDGSALWTETKSITITDGIFNTQLGSSSEINLAFEKEYWLGISVGSDGELSPRIKLSSVPYSFMTMNVMDGSIRSNDIASNQLVKSINSLTDDIIIEAGSNISITPDGNTITISSSGGTSGGDITAVYAGLGLVGGGETGDVTIAIPPGAINTDMLQDYSVNSVKIEDYTIVTEDLVDGVITNIKLAENSVSSSKIAEGSIQANDLGPNSVTSDVITDGSIYNSDLADGTITSDKISDGTVTAADLSVNSVGAEEIINGTITEDEIANSQVIKSINSLRDHINLIAGTNISITPGENNLTIASTAVGGNIGGTGTFGYLSKFTDGTTLGSSVLFETNNRIGLGTTTPDFNLTINSTSTEGLGIKVSRSGGGLAGLSIVNDSEPSSLRGFSLEVYLQKLRINSTEDDGYTKLRNLITFDRNGNVGIGTEDPLYSIHVASNQKYAGYFSTHYVSPSYEFISALKGEYVGGNNDNLGFGVWGKSIGAYHSGIGGYFEGGSMGAYGRVEAYSGSPTAITGLYGYAETNVGGEATGVFGYAGTDGPGKRYGIYGWAVGGDEHYAGFFNGDVEIIGTLSKSAGSFKIDHPLDPANKYLYHSFVESPDMMNIYNGNIATDASGYATVTLPDWFEALNKDFRYQLTVIGDFAQAIISKEIQNNEFEIRTDKPNIKISWQVTGIRHDAYAEENRIPIEENKAGSEIGKYLHTKAFNVSDELGTEFERNQIILNQNNKLK